VGIAGLRQAAKRSNERGKENLEIFEVAWANGKVKNEFASVVAQTIPRTRGVICARTFWFNIGNS
jgi:hypothetical protein